jgi:hypothetical protein
MKKNKFYNVPNPLAGQEDKLKVTNQLTLLILMSRKFLSVSAVSAVFNIIIFLIKIFFVWCVLLKSLKYD